MKEKYRKENLEPIIKKSRNFTEVFRFLNMTTTGNSRKTLMKYINEQNIDISHFETTKERYLRVNREIGIFRRIPLHKILISGSTYSNVDLKKRLYEEGLKERKCEKCGQDEDWYGERMALILDHINGEHTDNRFENLRIVCPNCNATLPTHCGKNKKKKHYCECGNTKFKTSDKCRTCSNKTSRNRKVERPPYDQLLKEIEETNYCAVGRKYGVSDNAIRKWVKTYENV